MAAETARPDLNPAKLNAVNAVLADAVQRREIPGAVVLLERAGTRWTNEYGNRSVDPVQRPMVVETIFDAASLTKVMATAPAVLTLVDAGKIGLDTPANEYLKDFKGQGKETITIRQMLTHTSGLRAGVDPGGAWDGYEAAIARAKAEPVLGPPGTSFVYSDINFILLGEVVRVVAGEGLDRFVQRTIYQPLAMQDTFYNPPPAKRDRIAPSDRDGPNMLHGVVHDPTARRMGGVAGHAGLFTNVRDAGRFCHMLLNRGKSRDGRVILSENVVRMLTEVQPPLPGGVRRTLGFDVQSGFSDCKGAHFGPRSFGHTGFTGPCFWMDPDADAFYVLLTNRVHPVASKGTVKNIRWQVATLAAEAMGVAKQVRSGADQVVSAGLPALEGKKIGLITNSTGMTTEGATTLEALQKIPGAKVVRLFSPEHGIQAASEEEAIGNSEDPVSKLPVISLYNEDRNSRRPPVESLQDLDALVFDIQDVGTRFYTYISTMLLCMEAADSAKLPFFVLDRVNPLGGNLIEGPLPMEVKNPFVACHSIPVRHSLTTGEMARLLVKEKLPDLKLTVVPLQDWQRRFFFSQTLAPWINPSPNMRSPEAALLYPGIGLLEFTNLSVGRGTDFPFHFLGAPWVDADALMKRLELINKNPETALAGVHIEKAQFKPVASKYAGLTCHGIRLTVTDPRPLRPVRLGITLAKLLHEQHEGKFELDQVNTLLFHPPTLQAIRDRKALPEIFRMWAPDEAAFQKRLEGVLLYQDIPR